jgi:peptide/nickel transport system permease protein
MSLAHTAQTPASSLNTRVRPTQGVFRRGLGALLRKRVVWVASAVLVIEIIAALIPLNALPVDPTAIAVADRFSPPSWLDGQWSRPFGTDNLGRDLAGRLIYAARYTLIITIAATVLASVGGALAGMLAGYYGGWVDTVIARLIDIQLSFPTIFLALAVIAVAGSSLLNVIIVLAIVDWAAFARVVRSSVIAIRNLDYIEAAHAMGASNSRILNAHVLPNVLAPIVVLTTYAAARILLVESSLSFLGLGVVPPAATWGTMVGDGRNYLHNAWWVSTIPGAVIALTVLAISFLGDAMRDAFGPQSK